MMTPEQMYWLTSLDGVAPSVYTVLRMIMKETWRMVK